MMAEEEWDDFEFAGYGLVINGKWYPPVYGGDDDGGGGSGSDGGDDSSGDDDSGDDDGEGPERDRDESPEDATANIDTTLSSADILARGRQLAIAGVPLQLANLLTALETLRARARGSTAEIFPAINHQLNDLREQYSAASRAISRRLGAAGGGQTKRAKQQLLGQTARQYGGLINAAQEQAYGQLINTLGGIQPFLSGAAREPSVSTAPGSPFNPAQLGSGIAGVISLAQQFGGNQNIAPFSNTLPGGTGSGINPWTNDLIISNNGMLGGGV